MYNIFIFLINVFFLYVLYNTIPQVCFIIILSILGLLVVFFGGGGGGGGRIFVSFRVNARLSLSLFGVISSLSTQYSEDLHKKTDHFYLKTSCSALPVSSMSYARPIISRK